MYECNVSYLECMCTDLTACHICAHAHTQCIEIIILNLQAEWWKNAHRFNRFFSVAVAFPILTRRTLSYTILGFDILLKRMCCADCEQNCELEIIMVKVEAIKRK